MIVDMPIHVRALYALLDVEVDRSLLCFLQSDIDDFEH